MVRYEVLKKGTESFQRSQPSFEKVRYELRQRKKGKAQDSKDKKENVQPDLVNEPPTNKLEKRIKLNQQDKSPINLIDETNKQVVNEAIGVEKPINLNTEEVFTKYKPVDKKVNPIKATLPDEFRIERHIHGDPLLELPELLKHPKPISPSVPTGRYTEERKEIIDKNHPEGFLWEQERNLMHEMMCKQEAGFAWEPSEAGTFKNEFFPPVKVPVIPHEPWVERNIPIPPGIFCQVHASGLHSEDLLLIVILLLLFFLATHTLSF
ncbi:hypothetical protein C8J55DRAFT_444404 [Lentinula edodes]|uniref:Uncharacterized protein n=1 Tax=Lentinula lateritia TaxID=40482 RepID=A0A9W8ZP82_9AGAR|nr:hypothetical protein C8J55DRAFT_444404 [Lentinula edodes]